MYKRQIMDRKYLYYYAADGIKRIDITQKTCNPQLVLKETANQELPDYFYPYNNKIYYTNTYLSLIHIYIAIDELGSIAFVVIIFSK